MPFGLTNAPRVFQRFINNVFAKLINDNKILLYLDDILIATENIKEHLEILTDVFQTAARNKLIFRLDKCSFLYNLVPRLHDNQNGIRPSKHNIESVLNYPIPRNTKEIQRFVSLASYFRRFIKNFAKPLYDQMKKNVEFRFELNENNAFESLKNILSSEPVLVIYSLQLPTELHCDASSVGLGAILL